MHCTSYNILIEPNWGLRYRLLFCFRPAWCFLVIDHTLEMHIAWLLYSSGWVRIKSNWQNKKQRRLLKFTFENNWIRHNKEERRWEKNHQIYHRKLHTATNVWEGRLQTARFNLDIFPFSAYHSFRRIRQRHRTFVARKQLFHHRFRHSFIMMVCVCKWRARRKETDKFIFFPLAFINCAQVYNFSFSNG